MVSSFVERCDISGVFGERVRRRAVAGGPRCRRCTGPRAMAGAAALVMLGSAAGAVTIETVPVGNPGNAAQATYGFGAVAYSYQIGKFEVTAGQYTEFLNAVAASDPNLLYDTRMSTSSYGCKIIRDGDPGSYTYSIAPDWANRPVNLVSWASAARFVNWLHNGQPTGPQSLSTTEDGSYFLNGAFTNTELAAVVRKSDATWVIPTIDEWYKAAYHYNDGVTAHYYLYPTGSDTAPSNVLADPDPGNSATYLVNGMRTLGAPYYRTEVGAHENSASPYGTFDQGGNMYEWVETGLSGTENRGIWGGSFNDPEAILQSTHILLGSLPDQRQLPVGFRVAKLSAPCPGDFNHSGDVSVQDIFDFLAAYFSNDPSADVNNSGAVTVQDIFDFLALYFTQCP